MFTVAQELNMKQRKCLLTDDYTGKTQMFTQWLIIYLTSEDNSAVFSIRTSPRENHTKPSKPTTTYTQQGSQNHRAEQ